MLIYKKTRHGVRSHQNEFTRETVLNDQQVGNTEVINIKVNERAPSSLSACCDA